MGNVTPNLPDPVEADLAERCSRDPPDEESWRELWNRYSRLAWFAIRSRVAYSNPAIIDDLVSDTFLRLLVSMPRYDPKVSRLGTFVTMIARNIAIDYLRHEKRRTFREISIGDAGAEPSIRAAEASIEMAAAKLQAELKPPSDEVDRLIFGKLLDGMRIQEVVTSHGVSEKAVRRVRAALLNQARGILADILPSE